MESESLSNTTTNVKFMLSFISLRMAGIISFMIYGFLVSFISPSQDHSFVPERSSLVAAISNVYYGTQLGEVYTGVLTKSFEEISSTEAFLAKAARKEIQPGTVQANTQDGNGIGYMLVADIAFRWFGPHISSIITVMLLMMGISAIAFARRFNDQGIIVVLYFTSLTLLLFTPLVWDASNVSQIPLGGIRYFSLVSILPALHLVMAVADRARTGLQDLFLLSVQVMIVLVAILVRNSAAPIIAVFGVTTLICLWKTRRFAQARLTILKRVAWIGLVGTVFICILQTSFSQGYVKEGRFTETVWHRVFVSLCLNTNFPYGNLREVYDCTLSIPEGLVPGPADRNGHCVALVMAKKHNVSLADAGGTYGAAYGAFLREAFFDIARDYPIEVLKTFTIVKAQYIGWVLSTALWFPLGRIPPGLTIILMLSLVNLMVAVHIFRRGSMYSSFISVAGVTGMFGLFSLAPLFAVWAMQHTSADLLFYCIFGLGLVLISCVEKYKRSLSVQKAGDDYRPATCNMYAVDSERKIAAPPPEVRPAHGIPQISLISVIIPIYNEEKNIPILLDQLLVVLNTLSTPFEIIAVNDGSHDGSLAELRRQKALHPELQVIDFCRNFGQTAAIMAGIDYAKGDVIISIDADLQNDPQDIPNLLAKLKEGFDVVSGWRKDRKDAKLRRNFVSRIANSIISKISGVKLHDYGCTLKAYRADVVKGVRLYGEMHRFIPIYASWMGAKVVEIPVNHRARQHGFSNYGLERVVKVILDLIVVTFLRRYMVKPIYIFGGFGLLTLGMAFVSFITMLGLKLFHHVSMISTPLPLITVMAVMTGITSILMGLLAEMLIRTYFESQDRPSYFVKINHDNI